MIAELNIKIPLGYKTKIIERYLFDEEGHFTRPQVLVLLGTNKMVLYD